MSEPTSTKPYLIRAIYEWCTDNGFTPYVAVFVNPQVVVPREYVKNGEIVLNVSFEATQGLKIGNDAITFKARFAGVARDIYVPTDNVVAIYARENGQGMAFPLPPALQDEQLHGARAQPHGGLHLATEPALPSVVEGARTPTPSESGAAGSGATGLRAARGNRSTAGGERPTAAATPRAKPKLAPMEGGAVSNADKAADKAAAQLSGKPADADLTAPAGKASAEPNGAGRMPEATPEPTPPAGGGSRPALRRIK